jgi:hypothetical protein
MAYPDFEEFIAELNAHGVRYLVAGAHALAHHARPRATKDLDILIDAKPRNARRLLDAVAAFFGGRDLDYTVEDVLEPDWFIQLGVAPVRIDLLTCLPGCARFEALWKRRVQASFGDEPANFLSLNDLIRAKTAAGRPQDLADLHELKKVQKSH